MKKLKAAYGALLSLSFAQPVLAEPPHAEAIRIFVDHQVREWLTEPRLVRAVMEQNRKMGTMSEADIIALDMKWRAETNLAKKPMIEEILSRDVSKYLRDKQEESGGIITEVFVMDKQGMNVGQSQATSDFWQGDEAKWQNTYLKGAGAMFIDDIRVDDSTGSFQSQVSMSVVDPNTGEVIGAITLGINFDSL
ncbi:MAG: PDC sensor domain-containing protein [Pseudomonadota bacterium]